MDSNAGIYIIAAAAALLLVWQKLRDRKASRDLVREKLAAGAKIVDVRTPREFSSGSYPKAKNIPLDALEARMGELPKDKPIVLFCASGARSARAARLLKRSGYSDVLSAGGLGDMPR
jgi:rhodanese-related sulfurtransferase